jgi:hypothetical protein
VALPSSVNVPPASNWQSSKLIQLALRLSLSATVFSGVSPVGRACQNRARQLRHYAGLPGAGVAE